MKQTIFTLLLITTIGFVSCRKNGEEPDIRAYDESQITAYIAKNNITGAVKDTSGMYYKIIKAGTGARLQYTDSVSFVYTVKTFDGRYTSADTIKNHYSGYVGHITTAFPKAVQTAVYEFLKNRGGSMRLIVPSRLGFGTNGAGSGSSEVDNNKINGNQCLEYYINTINDQPTDNQRTYDDMVIKNWLTANNLTSSYTRTPSGLYYRVKTPGTGTLPITVNSTITANYSNFMLNGTLFAEDNTTLGATIDFPDIIVGMKEGLANYCTAGSDMSFLIPSYLAYGKTTGTSIPANTIIRFDIRVKEVSQ